MKSRSLMFVFISLILISPLAFGSSGGKQSTDPEPELLNVQFRRSWGSEGDQFLEPRGVAAIKLDAWRKIFVADMRLDRVAWFDINPYFGPIGIINGFGSEQGQLFSPIRITSDGSQYIYVTDGSPFFKVIRFNAFEEEPEATEWSTCNGEPFSSGISRFGYSVGGMATDLDGNLYVVDTVNHRVAVFTSDGESCELWGEDALLEPVDVAIGPEGQVFILDPGSNSIHAFDREGELITNSAIELEADFRYMDVDSEGNFYLATERAVRRYKSDGREDVEWQGSCSSTEENFELISDITYVQYQTRSGLPSEQLEELFVTDSSQQVIKKCDTLTGEIAWERGKSSTFHEPVAVAIDEDDFIYVVEKTGGRVQKFDRYGTRLLSFGRPGTQDSEFVHPNGIAIAEKKVYVSDSLARRIQVFRDNGIYLRSIRGQGECAFDQIWGLTIDKSNDILYVVDTKANKIIRLNHSNDSCLGVWQQVGDWGFFNAPQNAAVDQNGNVYVVDAGNNRVVKMTPDGIPVWERNGGPLHGEKFIKPQGIGVDDHYVYVTDYIVHNEANVRPRVLIFTHDGDFISDFGGKGFDPGEFQRPTSVAVDSLGDIYVTDSRLGTVQVFSKSYEPIPSLIENGSFEEPAAQNTIRGWAHGGELPVQVIENLEDVNIYCMEGPHLLLGQKPVSSPLPGEGWAHQTIYVDPQIEDPLLVFDYRVVTNDVLRYADFFVAIQDGLGQNHLLTVLQAGHNGAQPPENPDQGCRRHIISLDRFRGEHIRIVFRNRNLFFRSQGIWTQVDNVRVVDSPSAAYRFFWLPIIVSE